MPEYSAAMPGTHAAPSERCAAPRIVLLCAMPKEVSALRSALSGCTPSVPGPFPRFEAELPAAGGASVPVTVLQTGIGKVHAALAAQQAIVSLRADLIVNIGVSGGLYAGAQIGDLCLSESFRYHDVWCGDKNEPGQVQGMPAVYPADRRCTELLAAQARREGIGLHAGLLLCGDTFIPRGDLLSRLAERHPDLAAVDMESAAIAQTAYIYGCPVVSLRIVSDTPLSPDDHTAQYRGFWAEEGAYAPPFERLVRVAGALSAYAPGR